MVESKQTTGTAGTAGAQQTPDLSVTLAKGSTSSSDVNGPAAEKGQKLALEYQDVQLGGCTPQSPLDCKLKALS